MDEDEASTPSRTHPFDHDSLSLDWDDINLSLSDLVDADASLHSTARAHDLLDFDATPASEQLAGPHRLARGDGDRTTLQLSTHEAVPQTAPRLSKKALLKEKNRQAQARYRQRKLEEVKEVEDKIITTQQRLNAARARLASNRAFSRELADRCKAVTTAMLTLTDPDAAAGLTFGPTSVPVAPPQAPTTAQTASAQAPTRPAPSAYNLSAAVLSTAQHSTPASSDQPPPAHLAPPQPQEAPPEPPEPLEPLSEHERISNSPLLPLMPPQPPLPLSSVPAALDPSAVFTHLAGPGPPLAGGPMLLSLQLFSATALGAQTWRGGAAQALPAAEAVVGQLGDELRRHRTAAAAAAGVEAADVAWYLQTPYTTPAGQRVSFSTALASPPCLASKLVFLVASCLESTFLSAALARTSVREGHEAGAAGKPDAEHAEDPPEDPRGTTPTPAETRAANASAMARETLERMSAVVRHYPLCGDALQGSCDVGGHFRVAAGAAGVVERMCQRFRRLLPRAVWIETCAVFAQLMLRQRSNRAPWLPCSVHGIYGSRSGAEAAARGGRGGLGRPRAAAGRGAAALQQAAPRDPRRAGSRPDTPDPAQRQAASLAGEARGAGGGPVADGVPPHDAAMCPRCGVLSCIAEVLRKVLQEVVEDASAANDARAQAALDAAVAAGELRGRARQLYAAYAVYLSECSTDAPHLTRHLKLNSTTADPQQKVAEQMTVKLFRQLRLPPRQLQLAAAAAEFWRQRREALDADLVHALAPLSALLTLTSLPRAPILQLCGLEIPEEAPADTEPGGGAPVPAPLRLFSRWLTLSTDSAASARAAHAAERGDAHAAVRLDLDAEADQGVCAACGVYGCSYCECERCRCEGVCGAGSWQRRLLGCDPAAGAAARAALRRLRAFQDADSRVFADMQRAVRMPGCLFTADQMLGGLPTALQHAVPFVDWLRVCQTAAGEVRVGSLRGDADAMGWVI